MPVIGRFQGFWDRSTSGATGSEDGNGRGKAAGDTRPISCAKAGLVKTRIRGRHQQEMFFVFIGNI
jgi:hypothetical protein